MATLRRDCKSVIISNKLGNEMQDRFNVIYTRLQDYVHRLFLKCKIDIFKQLLITIKGQNVLIDGFRIYLALDDSNLNFIFTGLIDHNDTGDYYVIDPNGNSFATIQHNPADIQVKNFQDNVLQDFKLGLSGGNTKSHAFIGLIKDFIDELTFQDSSSPVKGIKIKLGAYTNENNNPDKSKYIYTNRILIGFSFTKKDDSEVYLDLLKGIYGCKIPLSSPLVNGIGADTGTPCPPNSCTGTTLGH